MTHIQIHLMLASVNDSEKAWERAPWSNKTKILASTAMFGRGEMLGMTQIPASLQSNMQVESSAKGTGQRF